MGISRRFYEAKRMEQIASCLLKYELHFLLDSLGIKTHLPIHKRIKRRLLIKTEIPSKRQAEVLRKVCEELGGAFIKLGQVISLRPDLVGVDFAREFEKVLDDVEPEPFKTIVATINDNLPEGMRSFKSFASAPVAAGSIAQVHRATLKDGSEVAVKIQRPKVKEQFLADISIIRSLAERIEHDPRWQMFSALELVDEFRKYTLSELDFNHEAANMLRFRKNFKNWDSVIIPKVFKEYSNSQVLVMEYVDGIELSRGRKNLTEQGKRFVVETVSSTIMKQIFEDGFFHADLHPGNIMLVGRKRIALLDYGITGYLDHELMEKMNDLFAGLVYGDLLKVADTLISLNVGDGDVDREALKRGLHYTLADYYDQPIKNYPIGQIFRGAIDTARRSNIKMPANFVLLSKSLFTVDGFCRDLAPDFNIIEHSKPIVKGITRKTYSPKNTIKRAIETGLEYKRMVERAPRVLDQFSHELSLIGQRINKYEDIVRDYHQWMVKMTKALLFVLIIIPMLVIATIMIDYQPKYFNISIISWIGFIGSLYLIMMTMYILSKKTKH